MFAGFIGILSSLFSGLLNGSFATPMKHMTKWRWENIWLIWAVWALVIVPFVIAYITIPDLLEVYRAVDPGVLLKTFLFGAGWGAGAITFGMGLYIVGLSLGFSIIMSVTAVTGSLIPMLIFSPETVSSSGGIVIILGMVFTIVGVAMCGKAGAIKDRESGTRATGTNISPRFMKGLIICLASGILNSMLNLSFVFGGPIAEAARGFLSDSALVNFRASNSIWVLALAGGFLTNFIYCGGCLVIKGSWRNYFQPQTGIYWFYAFLMGTLWMTGVGLYGAGASSLGKLGATVAWIILMATTVIVGNIWGILSGEWRGAPKKSYFFMRLGLVFLIISIVLVSIGNYISK